MASNEQVPVINPVPVVNAITPSDTMENVGHVTKFNGENFSDYRYELMVVLEQLGLSSLIDTSRGPIETLPAEVNHIFPNYQPVLHVLYSDCNTWVMWDSLTCPTNISCFAYECYYVYDHAGPVS